MTRGRWTIWIILTAFLAAVAGVFVGRVLAPAPKLPGIELHDVLHRQLNLDDRQKAELAVLEQRFAVRRRAIEFDMRADNARLAAAIEAEHGNGPQVTAAVDASHAAMGALQKATLAHIFAMRQILRPDQARKFDQAVVKALTADTQ